jgi:pilus assembly protein Flp/PilA
VDVIGPLILPFAGAFMFHWVPRGQGLVEYALIILLVGVVVIVLVALFGTAVGNMFSTVINNF